MESTTSTETDPPTGNLYATLSMLVERERLENTFCGWEKKLKDVMGTAPGALARAVDPFFDDIADRGRNIFFKETLLAGNPRRPLAFHFPEEVEWATEGRSMTARFPGGWAMRAECFSFWYLHSNGALSYNLALELPYGHSIRDYFGMAVLQKAMFESEGTQWAGEACGLVEFGARPMGFWEFVRTLLEKDAGALFLGTLGLSRKDEGTSFSGLWKALAGEARVGSTRPAFHRAAFLLEDASFFEALGKPENERNPDPKKCPGLPPDGDVIRYAPGHLEAVEGWAETDRDLYFLSGFLRNIIDFLRQNGSEVKDGTDREYPAAEEDPATADFLLYVNHHSIFEVVRESRSLEAGRAYLGTCPYLFLVHMMAFQNEALVRRLEVEIGRLVERVRDEGLTVARLQALRASDEKMKKVIDAFDEHRLKIFEDVERYTHLNVFRYDTEQDFFRAVERVRGLGDRQAHWNEVLARLQETVASIRDRTRQDSEDWLNKTVVFISFMSVLQVVFAVPELLKSLGESYPGMQLWRKPLDLVVLVLLPVSIPVMVAAVVLARRYLRQTGGLLSIWRKGTASPGRPRA